MVCDDNSVFEQIKTAMPDLSKKQKEVADLILKKPTFFLRGSVRHLESDLGVSKSAIVRFSQKLGYKGYADFKSALWAEVEKKKTPIDRFEEFLKRGETLENPIQDIAAQVINNINNTVGNISPEAYAQAIEMINDTSRINVFGLGISSYLSQITAYLLNRVAIFATAYENGGLTFCEQIVNFADDELIIAFSYLPYSPETIDAVEFAAKSGHRIILFTDSYSNPACAFSDAVLITEVSSIAMANAIMSPLTIIYALTFLIGCNKKSKMIKKINSLGVLE